MVALVAAAVVTGALTGCAAKPDPATKPRLVVHTVSYDCSAHVLTVTGVATPARNDQEVQVQVRSVERPKAGVWRVTSTNSAGDFKAVGKFTSAQPALAVAVRLASVTRGVRVFSLIENTTLHCP